MEVYVSLAIAVVILFIAYVLGFSWNFHSGEKSTGQSSVTLPGPKSWETFQGFLKFGHDYHSLFTHWSQIYGRIYCCTIGKKKMVILNDYKSIKDSFNNPDLQGKPELIFINPLHFPKSGITRNDGDSWALQRKITSQHLRHFGFGKGLTEKLIMDEVQELLQSLRDSNGQSMNANKRFFFNAMNAVWIIMGGLRLTNDPKDTPKKVLFNTFLDTSEHVDANPFIAFIPSIVHWFPWIPIWKKYQGEAAQVRKFLSNLVMNHKNTIFDDFGPPTDFIYAYLRENVMKNWEKAQEEKSRDNQDSSEVYDPAADQQLEALMFDFVYAGMETTSTSFDWVNYHLVRHPEIQSKIHEELDRVIGRSRLPTLSDKPNLPYTEACLFESFRLTPIHPVGLMHECTADTEINGYPVSKSATIIPNVYAAHTDPLLVKNPLEFQPERFLEKGENGLTVVWPQYLMPFGTGRRICLGENLAKDTLWLFITAIYQHFEVRACPDSRVPELKEADAGILYAPPKFKVRFIKRE